MHSVKKFLALQEADNPRHVAGDFAKFGTGGYLAELRAGRPSLGEFSDRLMWTDAVI